MTVHNAKGLEFDVVLMTGMEEEYSRTPVPTIRTASKRNGACAGGHDQARRGCC